MSHTVLHTWASELRSCSLTYLLTFKLKLLPFLNTYLFHLLHLLSVLLSTYFLTFLLTCLLTIQQHSDQLYNKIEECEQSSLFYICSSGFVTNRKDGLSKISDGSRVKPKRVQVLPVASETPAYNHYEKGWLSQIKSKFLPVGEKRKAKPLSRAQKIDMASRVLFPFLYVVYNTVYWYIYLNGVEILA